MWLVLLHINDHNDEVVHCSYSDWENHERKEVKVLLILTDEYVTKVLLFLDFKNTAKENKKGGGLLYHLPSCVILGGLFKLSETV